MSSTEKRFDLQVIKIPRSIAIRPRGRTLSAWPWFVAFLIVLTGWGFAAWLAYPANIQAIPVEPFQAIENFDLAAVTPSLPYTIYISIPFICGLVSVDFSVGVLVFAATQLVIYAIILSYGAYWVRTKGAPLWLTFLFAVLIAAGFFFARATLIPDPDMMVVALSLLLVLRLYDAASDGGKLLNRMYFVMQILTIMACMLLCDARVIVLVVPTALCMVFAAQSHRIRLVVVELVMLVVCLAISGPFISQLGFSDTGLTSLISWSPSQFALAITPAFIAVPLLFVLFILTKRPRFLMVYAPLIFLWVTTIVFGGRESSLFDFAYLLAIPFLLCMPFIRDITSEKKEIRRQMLAARKALPPERRALAEQEICDELLQRLSSLDPHEGYIGLYAALGSELALNNLAVRLGARGYRIAYPAMLSTTEMDFYTTANSALSELNSTTLLSAPNKIMGHRQLETLQHVPPSRISALVVPAVAFDKQGYRLGQGGGYYDRYLRRVNKRVPTWGAGFKEQMLDSLPVERHDKRLKSVIVA
ncbi:MAG: 5-formyltetrahydrofolate cyclo-ligase [Coriobacteriales bacterium]|nr:5-formyltetrahydrofolate cyclo-ligase [Coriobacteriales bacterium]